MPFLACGANRQGTNPAVMLKYLIQRYFYDKMVTVQAQVAPHSCSAEMLGRSEDRYNTIVDILSARNIELSESRAQCLANMRLSDSQIKFLLVAYDKKFTAPEACERAIPKVSSKTVLKFWHTVFFEATRKEGRQPVATEAECVDAWIRGGSIGEAAKMVEVDRSTMTKYLGKRPELERSAYRMRLEGNNDDSETARERKLLREYGF